MNVNINSVKKKAHRIERLAPADTYRRFVVSSVWHVEPCLLSHSLFIYIYIFPQPSLSLSPFSLFVITRENMDEANGKMRSKHEDVDAASLSADILNPFVHRLELDTTYDKLKVSSSANLPARGNIPRNRCSRVRMFWELLRAGRGIYDRCNNGYFAFRPLHHAIRQSLKNELECTMYS